MLDLMEIHQKLNGVYERVFIEWKDKSKPMEKLEIYCDYAYGYYVYKNDDDNYTIFSSRKEKCVNAIMDYLVEKQRFIKSVEIKV